MLPPTRTKFRKAHNGRIHGNASRWNKMNYGSFGLKALQPERVISRQIEAARVALTRHMKRQGRVWTRIFPNIPVSKKPTEEVNDLPFDVEDDKPKTSKKTDDVAAAFDDLFNN